MFDCYLIVRNKLILQSSPFCRLNDFWRCGDNYYAIFKQKTASKTFVHQIIIYIYIYTWLQELHKYGTDMFVVGREQNVVKQ